uniref:Uncharacterized protein n=1 Tax=Noctiluca scintillans TaxID=2966 RepID=A0A7S1FIM1_NOCSC
MPSTNATRALEGCFISILVLFIVSVPYCFQEMPEQPLSFDSSNRLEALRTTMTVNGVPTHELQSWRRTTSCRKDIETLSPLMDDRCLDLEDKFSDSSVTHRLVPGAEDELDAKSEMQEEQEPCSNERISALSAVSFVIALVAGGIFSLDIFEAFPML